MGQKQKSYKRIGYSHLHLATLDGARLPSVQLDSATLEKQAPVKGSFFQRLLLDFACGCYLFYPIQQWEHLATDDEKERLTGET
ncbi:hypothetical protein G6M86_27815 (plasmid) [Agrobacterium tumefaciens]|uniref:Uncharacterized protein n=1 Tax=Agrobacterium tumefaciens TaxID=358 RepID=A0AAJ4N944_AGRTU|nr:hypothetical protein G6M86_27815 [Agrobacterium tumefaciens]